MIPNVLPPRWKWPVLQIRGTCKAQTKSLMISDDSGKLLHQVESCETPTPPSGPLLVDSLRGTSMRTVRRGFSFFREESYELETLPGTSTRTEFRH